jgi:hypothetical protein
LKSVIEYSRANGHQQVSETEKWIFETVCASSIEKIYSGIERVLIWIGIVIDGNLQPDGELGNKVTLDRMAEEIQGVYGIRPAVISHETLKILHELRLFSAKERDSYGFMVGSLNLEENAEKVIAIVSVVSNEINYFKAELAMREFIPKREYIPMINKYEIDINTPNTIKLLLKAYSEGQITAENAAWEIQRLNINGYLNPSVSEVILWSRNAGYGIPNPPDAEVAAQVEKAWKKFHPEKL